jgi:sugar O-acyltransferase (sialic acid O-acetyltransferase NeuD family)
MANVVIFGNGQIAEIAAYYLTHDSEHDVVAFAVDKVSEEESSLFGLPVVEFDALQEEFPPKEFEMFVALSYRNLNKVRAEKYEEVKAKGYNLISYVSSKSGLIGDFCTGDNCLILENQMIQPFSRIGNNVFVFNGVLIGHHSSIGDHCWLTTGTNIGGNTNVGDYCFFGMNSTAAHMVEVGDECFVGAGALVLRDAKDKGVYLAKGTDRLRLDSDNFLKLTPMD